MNCSPMKCCYDEFCNEPVFAHSDPVFLPITDRAICCLMHIMWDVPDEEKDEEWYIPACKLAGLLP